MTTINEVNLIGLICFYGTTIEVFFAYDYLTSKWLFCFDGNLTMINDWNGVQRKSIDYHLQPFLLIYTHSPRNSLNITPLLHRTLLQTTGKLSIDILSQKEIFPSVCFLLMEREICAMMKSKCVACSFFFSRVLFIVHD